MVRQAALLLLITSCCKSFAQKATVSFFAGSGLAYVKYNGDPPAFDTEYEQQVSSKFSPIIAPYVDLKWNKPVAGGISFETGIGYARRGYLQQVVNKTIYPNSTFHRYEGYYNTTIDYLRIPIMVSYMYQINKMHSVSVSLGMDYGFALTSTQKGYFVNSYSSGEYSRQEFQRKPEIKLLAGENRLTNYNAYWADFFLFDPAFAFHIQYNFQKRFSLRLSQSYSLYAHQARETSFFTSRLRFSGISVGYRF